MDEQTVIVDCRRSDNVNFKKEASMSKNVLVNLSFLLCFYVFRLFPPSGKQFFNGCDILVSTPLRLITVMREGAIDLSSVEVRNRNPIACVFSQRT